MLKRSPPQHRHDGTSPLPLGMDWSPRPRDWNGRDTVWPHDHTTGWSYCVTVPSWVILPKSRDSDPVVFYKVQIGLQSPEGITTTRFVLRRFNDFLKLFTDSLPPAPPKGLLRLKSRTLLEERRSSLEQWMNNLLCDLDLSRSVSVAAFLDLEAAARASFQDINEQPVETKSPMKNQDALLQDSSHSSTSFPANSSEYESDTAYEASEMSTRDDQFENLSLYGDLTNPIDALVKYGMSNIDDGLFMGQKILDQLEGVSRHKIDSSHLNTNHGSSSNPHSGTNGLHIRKLSNESIGSDVSSLNISGDGAGNEIIGSEIENSSDARILLPSDQRKRLNRVLLTMQQRLATAKSDMVDLLSRLNQETSVKDYLATKVKDLELELEATTQKNKENLQQAIVIEREKLTKMQWDMEEMKRKALEMEMKLKEKEVLAKDEDGGEDVEMISTRLQSITKQYEALEAKSKAEIKFLVKEFKSLKAAHDELKQQFSNIEEEKSILEKRLKQEEEMKKERKYEINVVDECRALLGRLQETNIMAEFGEECDLKTVLSNLIETSTELIEKGNSRGLHEINESLTE